MIQMIDESTRAPLPVQIAGQIMAQLTQHNAKPGDLLPAESKLAQQFGVSRPIMREALKQLAGQGFVEVVNGRGTLVRSLDASLTTDGQGGVTGRGRFELAEAHRGIERGTFRLQADERGAVLSIQDHLGRPLFDFSATDQGVSVKIKK